MVSLEVLSCLLSFLLGSLLPVVVRRLMRRPEVRDPVPEMREVRDPVPEVRELRGQVPEVREVREPEPGAHEMPHFVVRRREVRGRGMPYEVLIPGGGNHFHIDRDCFGLRRAIEANIRVRTACGVCCRDLGEGRLRCEG